MKSTLNEFYEMLIEQECSVVLQIFENENIIKKNSVVDSLYETFSRIYEYWPSDKNDYYFDDYILKQLNEKKIMDFLNIKEIIIKNKKNDKKRKMLLVHYYKWKDVDIPRNFDEIPIILKEISDYLEINPGKLCIHCLAGVGRTGTFLCIAIHYFQFLRDMKLDKLVTKTENNNVCNFSFQIYKMVSKLRKFRPGFVASNEQYMFIYFALNNILKQFYKDITYKND